jgi:hypothetical protein
VNFVLFCTNFLIGFYISGDFFNRAAQKMKKIRGEVKYCSKGRKKAEKAQRHYEEKKSAVYLQIIF